MCRYVLYHFEMEMQKCIDHMYVRMYVCMQPHEQIYIRILWLLLVNISIRRYVRTYVGNKEHTS